MADGQGINWGGMIKGAVKITAYAVVGLGIVTGVSWGLTSFAGSEYSALSKIGGIATSIVSGITGATDGIISSIGTAYNYVAGALDGAREAIHSATAPGAATGSVEAAAATTPPATPATPAAEAATATPATPATPAAEAATTPPATPATPAAEVATATPATPTAPATPAAAPTELTADQKATAKTLTAIGASGAALGTAHALGRATGQQEVVGAFTQAEMDRRASAARAIGAAQGA